MTHLGENVSTTGEAARATDAYLEMLDEVARRRLRAVPSLKLTHLGLDLGESALSREPRACRRARARDTHARVGRHGILGVYGPHARRSIAVCTPTHSNLACVVQSYLRRTAQDVERLIEIGATVRLCKGAYREPPEIAFPDKRDVDASYARLAGSAARPPTRSPAASTRPSPPTTSACSTGHVRKRRPAGSPPTGTSCRCSTGSATICMAPLRAAGQRLRVLVPYGADWYGYFMRRLAERPANLAFFFRQVVRG